MNFLQIVIPNALPMYLIVPNEGELASAAALLNVGKNNSIDDLLSTYNNLSMSLKNRTQLHWVTQLKVNNKIDTYNLKFPSKNISYGKHTDLTYIQLIAFVDRVFPSILGKIFQGG